MTKVDIWVVVPVYERQECIENLIDCFDNQTFKNYNLIIVDHGEKSISINCNNRIEVIKGSPEMWWSSAINYGINYVIENKVIDFKTPIIIMNDDVLFGPNYLMDLLRSWGGKDDVIIGSVCVETGTNNILYANIILNKKKARFENVLECADIDDINSEQLLPSDVLSGRGTLIPARVFIEVGLYHERLLPHYRADYELVYRAKKKGFRVYVSPFSIVYSKIDSHNQIGKGLASKKYVLFGRKSLRNLFDLFYYSYLNFNLIYGTYFFMLNACRTIGKVLFFGTFIYSCYKKNEKS